MHETSIKYNCCHEHLYTEKKFQRIQTLARMINNFQANVIDTRNITNSMDTTKLHHFTISQQLRHSKFNNVYCVVRQTALVQYMNSSHVSVATFDCLNQSEILLSNVNITKHIGTINKSTIIAESCIICSVVDVILPTEL